MLFHRLEGFIARGSGLQLVQFADVEPGEAAFLPCTFWLADNLALQGRVPEAREIFERLLKILPTAAVRDEGTSYHYLAASRTVGPSPEAVDAIRTTLLRHAVPFVEGATWTTDALYRETRRKVERRVAEGCLTVEMEAAAFFAVAAFRGVAFGQLLYAGDDLSGEGWDGRGWDEHLEGRELLFRLAAEAVLAL